MLNRKSPLDLIKTFDIESTEKVTTSASTIKESAEMSIKAKSKMTMYSNLMEDRKLAKSRILCGIKGKVDKTFEVESPKDILSQSPQRSASIVSGSTTEIKAKLINKGKQTFSK